MTAADVARDSELMVKGHWHSHHHDSKTTQGKQRESEQDESRKRTSTNSSESTASSNPDSFNSETLITTAANDYEIRAHLGSSSLLNVSPVPDHEATTLFARILFGSVLGLYFHHTGLTWLQWAAAALLGYWWYCWQPSLRTRKQAPVVASRKPTQSSVESTTSAAAASPSRYQWMKSLSISFDTDESDEENADEQAYNETPLISAPLSNSIEDVSFPSLRKDSMDVETRQSSDPHCPSMQHHEKEKKRHVLRRDAPMSETNLPGTASTNKLVPTTAEHARFLAGHHGDSLAAEKALAHYLSWHEAHAPAHFDCPPMTSFPESSLDEMDRHLWRQACGIAMHGSSLTCKGGGTDLARVVRMLGRERVGSLRTRRVGEEHDDDSDDQSWHSCSSASQDSASSEIDAGTEDRPDAATRYDDEEFVRDKDGHRIVLCQSALLDELPVNGDLSVYSTAMACYWDSVLDRNDSEMLTLVVDLRLGYGWRNLHVTQLVGLLRTSIPLLLQLFPERVASVIIYPIPSRWSWVWRIARAFLDRKTANQVHVVSGPKCTADAVIPEKELSNWLEESVVRQIESTRQSEMAFHQSEEHRG
jgi:CRAL/TRIO domain